MSLPDVASREQWLAARRRLLAREKVHTRSRDTVNAERRRPVSYTHLTLPTILLV